jgi:hypothetical protein
MLGRSGVPSEGRGSSHTVEIAISSVNVTGSTHAGRGLWTPCVRKQHDEIDCTLFCAVESSTTGSYTGLDGLDRRLGEQSRRAESFRIQSARASGLIASSRNTGRWNSTRCGRRDCNPRRCGSTWDGNAWCRWDATRRHRLRRSDVRRHHLRLDVEIGWSSPARQVQLGRIGESRRPAARRPGDWARSRLDAHGSHSRPLRRRLSVGPGEVRPGREILNVVMHISA